MNEPHPYPSVYIQVLGIGIHQCARDREMFITHAQIVHVNEVRISSEGSPQVPAIQWNCTCSSLSYAHHHAYGCAPFIIIKVFNTMNHDAIINAHAY